MPRQRTPHLRMSPPVSARPGPFPCTFICTACGAVEHTPNPALPEGWVAEEVGNDVYAYCPDDAIDIPSRSVIQ